MQIIRKFFDSPAAMPPMTTVSKYKDVADRFVYTRVTTDDVDRSGEIVMPDGVDWSAYMKLGSVLLNHNPGQPIAKCVDIQRVGNGLDAVVRFPDPGIPFADAVFAMVQEGLANGISIGFMPVETMPLDKGNPTRGPQRYVKSDMMEFSFTPTPCNKMCRVLSSGISASDARKMTVARLKDAPERERRAREIEIMKLRGRL